MIDIETNEELLYYNDLMELSNNQLNIEEVYQMTKLSEFAKDYEPSSKTKNIADLKEVSTDIDLIDDEFEIPAKGNVPAKKVKQKVIMQDNEKYRVPTSVIGQLSQKTYLLKSIWKRS